MSIKIAVMTGGDLRTRRVRLRAALARMLCMYPRALARPNYRHARVKPESTFHLARLRGVWGSVSERHRSSAPAEGSRCVNTALAREVVLDSLLCTLAREHRYYLLGRTQQARDAWVRRFVHSHSRIALQCQMGRWRVASEAPELWSVRPPRGEARSFNLAGAVVGLRRLEVVLRDFGVWIIAAKGILDAFARLDESRESLSYFLLLLRLTLAELSGWVAQRTFHNPAFDGAKPLLHFAPEALCHGRTGTAD